MKESIIANKSYDFAIKIVKLYKDLIREKKEYVLGKQILRSGTSIGANVEEALGGQSRNDFYAKICISYKEARETHYWLRLLTDTDIINKERSELMIKDCDELLKILGSIKKTTIKN